MPAQFLHELCPHLPFMFHAHNITYDDRHTLYTVQYINSPHVSSIGPATGGAPHEALSHEAQSQVRERSQVSTGPHRTLLRDQRQTRCCGEEEEEGERGRGRERGERGEREEKGGRGRG